MSTNNYGNNKKSSEKRVHQSLSIFNDNVPLVDRKHIKSLVVALNEERQCKERLLTKDLCENIK